MTPERWQQIDNLFQAAVELDPAERERLLDSSCAGDEELRREVASLITSDQQGVSFIDAPAFDAAASLLSDPEPALSEGQEIANYEVVGLLGRGGMGEVYLAHDKKLKRKVALKLLPAEYTSDKDRLRRFQQEAQAASALNHPNILTIHELGEVNGQQFIATEFVDGQTLRERLKRGPLKFGEALGIAIEVASALSSAHRAGIIHRDIKPENIMLRPDGYVKVLDFGLAKLIKEHEVAPTSLHYDTGEQSSSLVMGTIKYMSPEQAKGQPVDQRSDIFSFGVVLYEMLFGRAPFIGKTTSELITSILNDKPALSADIGDALQLLIRKSLSKDKNGRYESMEALLTDLKTLRKETDPDVLDGFELRDDSNAIVSARRGPMRVASAATAATVEYVAEGRQYQPGAIFALVALMIVAAGVSFGVYHFAWSRQAAPLFQSIAITKFTNFGDAWAPSISPDGKYVVYARNNQQFEQDRATFSLWLRTVGSTDEVCIVPPTPGRCYTTAFSPDGQTVYYGEGTGEPVNVFMVRVSGGTPTQLPLERGFPVGISRDGKFLAYVESNPSAGTTSVMVANSDGTGQEAIVTRNDANFFRRSVKPSWSPDGKLIACVGQDRARSFPHVFVVNVESRTEQIVTSQKWTEIRGVAWLPDMKGLMIVAAEEISSIPQLWKIAYPGGEAKRVTNDAVNYSRLDLTLDGRALVTTAGEILTSIDVMPVKNGEPDSNKPLTVDSSQSRRIDLAKLTSRDDLNNLHQRLSWTPDGRIVFMSKENGNADIWSIKYDGSDRRQLTTDLHSDSDSVVSPDGRYIAFVSSRSGPENIWIMDADGRHQRQLTSQFIERSPEFSADSKWVFFNSWETGKATIWKVPVDGGAPVPVTHDASYYPQISPDGNWLAYANAESSSNFGKTFVLSTDGGLPAKSFPSGFGCKWTPGGRGLSYSGAPRLTLWERPLTAGQPRQLIYASGLSQSVFSHAWSPDGAWLAVMNATYSSDVVLMTDVR